MKPDQAEGIGKFAITDPERDERESAGIATDTEYPKHLHKAVGVGQAHEYVVVVDHAGELKARKDGFGSAQDADAVNRAAADKSETAAPAAPAKKGKK